MIYQIGIGRFEGRNRTTRLQTDKTPGSIIIRPLVLSRVPPTPLHCDRLRAFDRVIKNPILLFLVKYNPRGPITFSITAFNCALLFDAGIVPYALPYVNQQKKWRAKMFARIFGE